MRQVYALVHEAEGSVGISFPDFPGCVAAGSSLDEALERGRAALAFHVATMIEEGEPMPALRSRSELEADLESDQGARSATLASMSIGQQVPLAGCST